MDDTKFLARVYESASERAGMVASYKETLFGGASVMFVVLYVILAKISNLLGVSKAISVKIAAVGLLPLAQPAIVLFALFLAILALWASLQIAFAVLREFLMTRDCDLHAPIQKEPPPRYLIPMINATATQALKDSNIKELSLKYSDQLGRWEYHFSLVHAYPIIFFIGFLLFGGVGWLLGL